MQNAEPTTTLVMDVAGKVRHANYGLAERAKLVAQLQDVWAHKETRFLHPQRPATAGY